MFSAWTERQKKDLLASAICGQREDKRDEMEGAHPLTVCRSSWVSLVNAQRTHIHEEEGDSSSHSILLLFLSLLLLTDFVVT